jgi:hypothetical protein
MNNDEVCRLLETGESLGLVLYETQLTPEVKVQRLIGICKQFLDPRGLHSWHYLQENPSYVRDQSIITKVLIMSEPWVRLIDGLEEGRTQPRYLSSMCVRVGTSRTITLFGLR